ncbi:MAG: hypothetical protein ACPGQL_08360 [Thermoplasmatota archaeon]
MAPLGPLQPFVDSKVGAVLLNTLHTAGAIGFLGGLMMYVAWHRSLATGGAKLRTLAAAGTLTYFSITINFIGGALRTYQSGHPELTRLADNTWVQVLLIKHVFLVVSIIASFSLFERTGPGLHRLMRSGELAAGGAKLHRRQAREVFLIVAGILVASLLGAVSTVTPLGLDDGDGDGGPDGMGSEPALVETLYTNATGRLTSSLLTARSDEVAFQVPEGYGHVEATLSWGGPFTLDLAIFDPDGTAAGTPEAEPGQVVVALDDPPAGSWRAVISSDAAVDVAYQVTIKVAAAASDEALLASTVTLAPGVFYEINTEMDTNGTIRWDWRIAEDAEVHFDLHTHFDGEVQYHIEGDHARHAGSFDAYRDGGYSLLWRNDGAVPLTLGYRVWGDFELDSIVG